MELGLNGEWVFSVIRMTEKVVSPQASKVLERKSVIMGSEGAIALKVKTTN